LVFRVKEKISLAPQVHETNPPPRFEKGYTDYPFSKEFEAAGLV